MISAILWMAAGLALLYIGAEGLVRGGARLALRLGLTPLAVGLTVVAFGTSSPELVVSFRAALAGAGSLAVGNVVGSNICNIALILALAALICPLSVRLQIVRVDVPIAIFCSVLLLFLLMDQEIGRLEGVLLTGGLLIYTAVSLRLAKREDKPPQETIGALPASPRNEPLWKDSAMIAGGLAGLVIGAQFFVDGAVAVAQRLGISEAVIGLTVVAVGTSLPELAASVVAALKREVDMAIGNVVGSNIFNILGILGVASLARPMQTPDIGWGDLGMMVFVACLLLPLMRSGFRLSRLEAIFLLGLYFAYLGSLAMLSNA